ASRYWRGNGRLANEPQKKGFTWDDFDKAQPAGGKKPFTWGDEAASTATKPTPEQLEANRARNAQPTQFEKDRAGDVAISNAVSEGNRLAGKALSSAGLPTSINDIGHWGKGLAGANPDSQPFWQPVKNAIANPTQENLVSAVPIAGPIAVNAARDVRGGDYRGAAADIAGGLAPIAVGGQVKPGLTAARAELADANQAANRIVDRVAGHSIAGS